EHVEAMGQHLAWHLQQLRQRFPRFVVELRGEGLLAGIKITPPGREFVARLRADHRLLAQGAGDNVLRLRPPVAAPEAALEHAGGRIADAFAAIAAETAAAARAGA